MPRGPKNNDPFADLDLEYKESVERMTAPELNAEIAKVARNQQENLLMLSLDGDLAEQKALVKKLSAPYDAVSKKNAERISAIHKVLKDNGLGSTTSFDLSLQIAEAAKAEEENQAAKELDQALEEAKLAAKEAGEVYKEATKANALRVKFCVRCLGDKGHS